MGEKKHQETVLHVSLYTYSARGWLIRQQFAHIMQHQAEDVFKDKATVVTCLEAYRRSSDDFIGKHLLCILGLPCWPLGYLFW